MEGKTKDFKKQEQKKNYEMITKNVLKLMKYTQGENQTKSKINFLMPVFVQIENTGQNSHLEAGQIQVQVEVLLSLPLQYQPDNSIPNKVILEAPVPLDSDIKFKTIEKFKCYVK